MKLFTRFSGSIRNAWHRLWVRKDEFHPSLDFDADYYFSLPPIKRRAYDIDLARRRRIAHERDLATEIKTARA
ncbi:MAG TPA: hypothetical protein VHD69_01935 [Candidatus Paceibacterota bacterium]|nr:hypothetical protein [Candidatus Paceibacterota bacterium]